MKYRILEELYSDGRHFFKPQYRYSFWPFWFYYWPSDTGGSLSSYSFDSMEKAAKFIYESKKSIDVVVERNHYFTGCR